MKLVQKGIIYGYIELYSYVLNNVIKKKRQHQATSKIKK